MIIDEGLKFVRNVPELITVDRPVFLGQNWTRQPATGTKSGGEPRMFGIPERPAEEPADEMRALISGAVL